MARGRMLNRSISYSKKVAALVASVGTDGGLFWTWMVPHLDRDGRIHGDPDVLKGMVAPRIAEITTDTIRKTIPKAHELGLINWYEVDGDSYIEFPGFADNQPNLRYDREPESQIPAPTSDNCRQVAGTLPAGCRQVADTLPPEEKRREEKIREVEEKRREENDLSSCGAQPDRRAKEIHEVFDHYRTIHTRAHKNPDSKLKEWKAIAARLREGYTVQDLVDAINGMHQTPHNCGQNERNQQYLGLELCMRNASQVERFRETAHQNKNGMRFVKSSREMQSELAAQQWLEYREGKANAGL